MTPDVASGAADRLPARIHPLLRSRYSPSSFDPRHTVSDRDVEVLLEAARWAPSAGNSQPWLFLPVLREGALHHELIPLLAPSSREWAADASLVVLNFAKIGVDGLVYSEFSDFDLGQAVAHMTIQAQAMSLHSRQFRAFDLEAVSRLVQVSTEWHLRSMTAIGRAFGALTSTRERRHRSDLVAHLAVD